MNAMFKLFYNTIAACQRPVGPLLSNKCMYVCMYNYVAVSANFCSLAEYDMQCNAAVSVCAY